MNTFKNTNSYELTIKKSKFIALTYKVTNPEEIVIILNDLKAKYKDSTHICYAYIINSSIKFFDDNEPAGTAGNQILKILEKNNLNYSLGVVIRYFGGIKLGLGNLSRTYFKVFNESIKNCVLEKIVNEVTLVLETDIINLKLLNNLVSKTNIINKTFADKVTYTITIEKINLQEFLDKINDTSIKYKIVSN